MREQNKQTLYKNIYLCFSSQSTKKGTYQTKRPLCEKVALLFYQAINNGAICERFMQQHVFIAMWKMLHQIDLN